MTELITAHLFEIGVALVAIILVLMMLRKRPHCPNCETKMREVDYNDLLEPTITGKIRLNLTTGVPHKIIRHYKCPKCGKKLSRKEMSWDAI